MIILVMLGVAVLGALAFSAWRVVTELRLLNRSLTRLQARIAPTLEQIARDGEAAAERAAGMQARAGQVRAGQVRAGQVRAGYRAAERPAAEQRPTGPVPDRPEPGGHAP